MRELLYASKKHNRIYTHSSTTLFHSTMSLFSGQSVSTTSTIDTEDDDSISEAAGDGNGRRGATGGIDS
jgi:hypothetical protein